MQPLDSLMWRRKLRLDDLAELAGVSAGSLSRLRRGHVKPTAESSRRLAEALGVTEDELWDHSRERAA